MNSNIYYLRGFDGYVDIVRKDLAAAGIPPHSITLSELKAAYEEQINPADAANAFRDHFLSLTEELCS